MRGSGVALSVVAGSFQEQPFADRRRAPRNGSRAGANPHDPAEDLGTVSIAQVETLVVRSHLRAEGLDDSHVAAFCELEGRWPPLLVWARHPEVVLDGAHRLAAARRLGHSTVQVLAFDGSADQAFVEAVRRNVEHGLPLSVGDRTRAGEHMLRRHTDWSNRRVAEVCGLSPHTVAKLRASLSRAPRAVPAIVAVAKRAANQSTEPVARRGGSDVQAPNTVEPCSSDRIVDIESRLGRDGKNRPAQPGMLRERVVEALRANPGASLRQIASVAKVSPETVRRIRKEVDQPGGHEISLLAALRAPAESETEWRDDPALKANPELVSWLDGTDPAGDLESFALSVPLSRVYELADEARRRAGRWAAFAEVLESRARARTRGYSLV